MYAFVKLKCICVDVEMLRLWSVTSSWLINTLYSNNWNAYDKLLYIKPMKYWDGNCCLAVPGVGLNVYQFYVVGSCNRHCQLVILCSFSTKHLVIIF